MANAPNLPVHLGSMSEAVKWQIQYLGDSWHEGDVILTNHPCAGGSHLPDLTVITPVRVPPLSHTVVSPAILIDFHSPPLSFSILLVSIQVYNEGQVVFYVASRGHHADIGGISPGSMPPFSTRLSEVLDFISFYPLLAPCLLVFLLATS